MGAAEALLEQIVAPLDEAAADVDVDADVVRSAFDAWRSVAQHLGRAAEVLALTRWSLLDGEGGSHAGAATGVAFDQVAQRFETWVRQAAERADDTQRVLNALQARQRALRDLIRDRRLALAARSVEVLLPLLSASDPRSRAAIPAVVAGLRAQAEQAARELVREAITMQLGALDLVDRQTITELAAGTKAYYDQGSFVLETLDGESFRRYTFPLGSVH